MQILAFTFERVAHRAMRPGAWRVVLALAISAALVLSLMQMPCCDSVLAEAPTTVSGYRRYGPLASKVLLMFLPATAIIVWCMSPFSLS